MRRPPSSSPRPSPPVRTGSSDRRRILVVLLVATAAFRMTQNMAATTLSLLAGEAVHLGAGAIGVLGAVMGLTSALVMLFLSRLVPHRRAAASAAAGMVLLTASLLVIAAAPSFAVMAVGAVLLGAAGGIAMPGLLNAVVSQAGESRERVIALYTVTLSVSLAIGPLLETGLLSAAHQSVRLPYLAFAPLPILGASSIVLARRRIARSGRTQDQQTAVHREPGDRAEQAENLVVGMSAEDITTTAPVVTVRPGGEPDSTGEPGPTAVTQKRAGLLSTVSGRLALVSQLLYGIPFAGVTVFGALVAHIGFGASPARAQLGFSVFFVFSLGARAAVAWKAPILHKRALLYASAALTAGGLLLLGLGHGPTALFVAMGMLGLPHGLTFPLALALVADATPIADLPRANATLLGTTGLTSVVVPLVLGAVIPVLGYQGMTLVLLVPVGVFGLMQLGLRPRRPL